MQQSTTGRPEPVAAPEAGGPAAIQRQTPAPLPVRLHVGDNRKLAQILRRVNADEELRALWKAANINAIDRLGLNDHGRVHVRIVANHALKLLRMLADHGVEPSLVRHHGLTRHDAEVVVVLAALLHDVGICVHRDEHEHHSLWIAAPKLKELLDGLYDVEARTAIWADTLHAIVAHNKQQRCLTVEAGVVRVADAMDMTKGRSRIPFEAGEVNIHSLSAYSIERVDLVAGEERPIRISVRMKNSAGLFQIDELLKAKLRNSGLERHVEVVATIEAESEERLVSVFRF
jgi:metal-dependent HD superfamily phosphatase/phosphodiesterase